MSYISSRNRSKGIPLLFALSMILVIGFTRPVTNSMGEAFSPTSYCLRKPFNFTFNSSTLVYMVLKIAPIDSYGSTPFHFSSKVSSTLKQTPYHSYYFLQHFLGYNLTHLENVLILIHR